MNEEEKEVFYDYLMEKVMELKMRELFEEPCPLYENMDEE